MIPNCWLLLIYRSSHGASQYKCSGVGMRASFGIQRMWELFIFGLHFPYQWAQNVWMCTVRWLLPCRNQSIASNFCRRVHLGTATIFESVSIKAPSRPRRLLYRQNTLIRSQIKRSCCAQRMAPRMWHPMDHCRWLQRQWACAMPVQYQLVRISLTILGDCQKFFKSRKVTTRSTR